MNLLGGTLNGTAYNTSYNSGSNRINALGNGAAATSYRADGSPSSYGYFTMRYGDFGRLIQAQSTVDGGPMVSYTYNALGQRVAKLTQVYSN